jgi:hypothetical protein
VVWVRASKRPQHVTDSSLARRHSFMKPRNIITDLTILSLFEPRNVERYSGYSLPARCSANDGKTFEMQSLNFSYLLVYRVLDLP